MMRKIQLCAGLALLLLVFTAMGGLHRSTAQTTPALRAAVSIQPMAGIVREVGGAQTAITVLLPEGVEPHAFSLTPAVIEAANAADLLVLTGHFTWEEDLVLQTGKPYITLDDYEALGAELLPLHGSTHSLQRSQTWTLRHYTEHDENLHGYWLLPSNAVAIANATRILCSSLSPAHTEYWQARFDEFVSEVAELEAFIDEQSAIYNLAGNPVVITFPAEAYVAAALGLDVRGLLTEGGNIFISGNELVALEQELHSGAIHLIIASDVARLQTAGEFAQQLSTDSGVPLVWLRIIFSTIQDYIGIMTYNIGVITTGLSSGAAALDFYAIGLPIILMAAIISVIAIIECVLLVRYTRTRE
ncbi:MAG: metal ABC transporter substrate-binding protein [Promethearchaeota archaeon]